MEKILIDTDIGDDIDDVLALCYLFLERKVEILGITTVFHNVWEKAKLTKCLLARAGMAHIPVYTGEACPLAGIVNTREPLNYSLKDMDGFSADGEDAAKFLAEMLLKSFEELTLYAIGPLTNIAKLVKEYPEALGKIRRLVIMGGAYYKHYIEWNILCDPEAAAIVMESGIPIEAVGADVTWQCQMNREQVDAIVNAENPLVSAVGGLIEQWMQMHSQRMPTLHDPLAAAWLMGFDYLKMEEIFCRVECGGNYTRGMTVNESFAGRHKKGACRMLAAKEVDAERFSREFTEALTRRPLC